MCLVLAASAYGALLLSQNIQGDGNIATEGGIEVSTNNIAWGTLNPTSVNTRNVTVVNVGNVPLTITFGTTTLPQGMTITYSMQGGNSLAVGQSKPITITLTCNDAAAGAFSYTTTVTGNQ